MACYTLFNIVDQEHPALFEALGRIVLLMPFKPGRLRSLMPGLSNGQHGLTQGQHTRTSVGPRRGLMQASRTEVVFKPRRTGVVW